MRTERRLEETPNLLSVSGRQGYDGAWSAEPASLLQRRLGASGIAALWATLVLSGPTILLGFSLASEGFESLARADDHRYTDRGGDGWHHPLARGLGRRLQRGAHCAGAPPGFRRKRGGLLRIGARPSRWSAGRPFQLQAAADSVAMAFLPGRAARAPETWRSFPIIGLVSGGLALIGPCKVTPQWISRVVFGVAVVAVGLAIWLLSTQPDPAAPSVRADANALWLGIDSVLALGILWFPLDRRCEPLRHRRIGGSHGYRTRVRVDRAHRVADRWNRGAARRRAGKHRRRDLLVVAGFAGLIVIVVWMLGRAGSPALCGRICRGDVSLSRSQAVV